MAIESTETLIMEDSRPGTLSVHWSAVFAGVFIAMLTYFILMSLGFAVGASSLKSVVQGDGSMQGLGTGAGIWSLISVLISLFVGSYASGRVSGIIATRVGYTQGAVITAMFFTILLSGIGVSLGAIGAGLGSASRALMGAAGQAAANPAIHRIVEDAVGDLNIDRPELTTAGIVARLVGGDQESAITLLSERAHIPREQAVAKIQSTRDQINNAMVIAGQKTADAAKILGWSAFITMLLGAISSLFGGAVGAQVNFRKPVDKLDRRLLRPHQPAFST